MTDETQEQVERPLFAQRARHEMARAADSMTLAEFREHAIEVAELAALLRWKLDELRQETLMLHKLRALATDVERMQISNLRNVVSLINTANGKGLNRAARASALMHALNVLRIMADVEMPEPYEFDPAAYQPFMSLEFDVVNMTTEKEPV